MSVDGAIGAAGQRDGRRQQPVVGPDQHARAAGDLDRDGAPRRPDTGIDDRQHDAVGDVGDRPGERQRAAAHVVAGGCRG